MHNQQKEFDEYVFPVGAVTESEKYLEIMRKKGIRRFYKYRACHIS
ncbi:hypothetical protein ACP70R_002496 [Stipagrostis hirtigluma subsp. patula]